MEQIEKIYCCDRGSCNNDLGTAALLNGMNNGFGGNNNVWLLFLLLLSGRGWNGFGNGNGVSSEFSILQNQAQDNQNATLLREAMRDNYSAIQALSQTLNCDFNTLQQCCCDLKQAIATVGGQVGFSAEKVINAINLGNTGIITAVKDCCCQTQKELIQMAGDIKLQNCQMTGELRNGQRDLGQAITQGFSASSFETKSQTCDIIKAITEAQQKTNDLLTSHWSNEQAREIQDLKNEISQLKQTDAITKAVFARLNGCGCNNGCNSGCNNGLNY